MTARWLALAAVLVLLAAGCTGGTVRLEATFDDVIDLVQGAPVHAGDVPIGSVTAITLTDDHRARVTMEVTDGSGLPARVEAVLKQTSLLGERYVELVTLEPGGQLSSGTIERTRVVADLEDLVRSGNDLLAGVAADRLASAVAAGAVALGDRGGTVGTLLDRARVAVGTYEDGTDEVLRLIDAADRLVGTLADEADAHAAALGELSRAADALAEEDERLLDALEELRGFADIAAALLEAHRPELTDGARRLRLVLADIVRIDGALQQVLTWLPRHNLHVPNGVLFEMAQVWNDFTVCGFDSEEDDPSRSCDPPNPGEQGTPPPEYEGPDACDAHHEGCPYPEGAEPYRPGDDRRDR